jgi:hypothetical protein
MCIFVKKSSKEYHHRKLSATPFFGETGLFSVAGAELNSAPAFDAVILACPESK